MEPRRGCPVAVPVVLPKHFGKVLPSSTLDCDRKRLLLSQIMTFILLSARIPAFYVLFGSALLLPMLLRLSSRARREWSRELFRASFEDEAHFKPRAVG